MEDGRCGRDLDEAPLPRSAVRSVPLSDRAIAMTALTAMGALIGLMHRSGRLQAAEIGAVFRAAREGLASTHGGFEALTRLRLFTEYVAGPIITPPPDR